MAVDANGGAQIEASAGAWTDGDWSVSLWVNAASLGQGNNRGIFSNGQSTTNHFQIDMSAANTYRAKSNSNTDNLSFGSVVVGAWTHLVLVRSASAPSRSIYNNGSLVTSVSTDFAQTSQTFDLYRLGINRGGSLRFDGLYDDLRVYRGKLLNAEEVATIYSARGTDGIVDGLEGRWTMNEGSNGSSVVTLLDSGPGGVDLTAQDTPLYTSGELRLRRRVA